MLFFEFHDDVIYEAYKKTDEKDKQRIASFFKKDCGEDIKCYV
jgi:hypothetical protein